VWLIYALGGGWGHLTRAASLARLAAADRPVRILTNSPYAGEVRARLPDIEVVALSPELLVAQARQEAVRQVESAGAACLIVDTFPRGLAGELAPVLPTLRALRVLIHRDLNPAYVRHMELREFVRSGYDLVIQPGETEAAPLAGLPQLVRTAPWLIRSVGELPSRDAAHRLLDVKEERCVLVCASGNREELEWYGRVTEALIAASPDAAVRAVAAVQPPGCPDGAWLRYWPAMDLLPGADVVVGGAGYNTVSECAACGVPLVARAWPRKYDRQSLRATSLGHALIERPEEAPAAVRRALNEPVRKDTRRELPNGASEAVKLIMSRL
jgi:hypothetical protein